MKNNESGRSMVEMLGVLAIMGILSIGGIAGYTYAMNKLRANNTIKYVNMLAIAGSQQAALGRDELTLGEFPAKTADGYDADIYRLTDEPRYFDIDIAGVPRAVCTNILALATHWRGLDSVWVNDNQTTCEQYENLMSFIFSETLGSDENGGSRCTQDSECSGCQTCVRGFCTDTDAACSGNTPYCVNGTCQGCHAGEFQDTKGKCHACGGDNVIEGVDQSECTKCQGQRFYYSYYQRCVPCNSPQTWLWGADSTSCQACKERYMDNSGSCHLCLGEIISDASNNSVCRTTCPAGQLWGEAAYKAACYPCNSETERLEATASQDCSTICPGIRMPWANNCIRCDAKGSWATTKASCLSCTNNRYWSGSFCHECNGVIIQNQKGDMACEGNCPSGQVWKDSECVSCDSTTPILYGVSVHSCSTVCKGVRLALEDGNQCILCNYTGSIRVSDKESCLACGNRTWKNGICSFCAGTVSADGTTCE